MQGGHKLFIQMFQMTVLNSSFSFTSQLFNDLQRSSLPKDSTIYELFYQSENCTNVVRSLSLQLNQQNNSRIFSRQSEFQMNDRYSCGNYIFEAFTQIGNYDRIFRNRNIRNFVFDLHHYRCQTLNQKITTKFVCFG